MSDSGVDGMLTGHILQVWTWHVLPPSPFEACTSVTVMPSDTSVNVSNWDSAIPSIERVMTASSTRVKVQ